MLCSFSLQLIFFSEQPFYGKYSTLHSHTNTVISHKFAYSSRWRRKPWQGRLIFTWKRSFWMRLKSNAFLNYITRYDAMNKSTNPWPEVLCKYEVRNFKVLKIERNTTSDHIECLIFHLEPLKRIGEIRSQILQNLMVM